MRNKTWLSVHIFYHLKHDFLLINGIKPFVVRLLEQKLIEKYFFIRYYEGGSHIRLRLYGERDVLSKKVKRLTQVHFKKFLEKFPTERPADNKTPNAEKLHPNNSLQFIPYEQEIERYGSKAGMVIAQESFHASSRAILEAIGEMKNNSGNHLIPAIKMHTAFFSAIFDKRTAISFLDYNIKVWLPKLFLLKNNEELLYPLGKEQIQIGYDFVNSQFLKQAGKEAIMSMINAIWKGVKRNAVFEENWLNDWIKSTKRIHKKVASGFRKGILKLEIVFPDYLESVGERNKFKIALYDSYVHMTNNRLGILNFDEPLIAYFILKSLTYKQQRQIMRK